MILLCWISICEFHFDSVQQVAGESFDGSFSILLVLRPIKCNMILS